MSANSLPANRAVSIENRSPELRPPRFVARSAILTDTKVSDGSKVLFLYLDDIAMGQPSVFEKQFRTAARLNISTREVRNRVLELDASGYMKIERTGRSNIYRFVWGNTNACSDQEQQYRNRRSDQIGTGVPVHIKGRIQERLQESPLSPQGGKCLRCRGRGRNGRCSGCGGSGLAIVLPIAAGEWATAAELGL